jgi:hypothetical protein
MTAIKSSTIIAAPAMEKLVNNLSQYTQQPEVEKQRLGKAVAQFLGELHPLSSASTLRPLSEALAQCEGPELAASKQAIERLLRSPFEKLTHFLLSDARKDTRDWQLATDLLLHEPLSLEDCAKLQKVLLKESNATFRHVLSLKALGKVRPEAAKALNANDVLTTDATPGKQTLQVPERGFFSRVWSYLTGQTSTFGSHLKAPQLEVIKAQAQEFAAGSEPLLASLQGFDHQKRNQLQQSVEGWLTTQYTFLSDIDKHNIIESLKAGWLDGINPEPVLSRCLHDGYSAKHKELEKNFETRKIKIDSVPQNITAMLGQLKDAKEIVELSKYPDLQKIHGDLADQNFQLTLAQQQLEAIRSTVENDVYLDDASRATLLQNIAATVADVAQRQKLIADNLPAIQTLADFFKELPTVIEATRALPIAQLNEQSTESLKDLSKALGTLAVPEEWRAALQPIIDREIAALRATISSAPAKQELGQHVVAKPGDAKTAVKADVKVAVQKKIVGAAKLLFKRPNRVSYQQQALEAKERIRTSAPQTEVVVGRHKFMFSSNAQTRSFTVPHKKPFVISTFKAGEKFIGSYEPKGGVFSKKTNAGKFDWIHPAEFAAKTLLCKSKIAGLKHSPINIEALSKATGMPKRLLELLCDVEMSHLDSKERFPQIVKLAAKNYEILHRQMIAGEAPVVSASLIPHERSSFTGLSALDSKVCQQLALTPEGTTGYVLGTPPAEGTKVGDFVVADVAANSFTLTQGERQWRVRCITGEPTAEDVHLLKDLFDNEVPAYDFPGKEFLTRCLSHLEEGRPWIDTADLTLNAFAQKLLQKTHASLDLADEIDKRIEKGLEKPEALETRIKNIVDGLFAQEVPSKDGGVPTKKGPPKDEKAAAAVFVTVMERLQNDLASQVFPAGSPPGLREAFASSLAEAVKDRYALVLATYLMQASQQTFSGDIWSVARVAARWGASNARAFPTPLSENDVASMRQDILKRLAQANMPSLDEVRLWLGDIKGDLKTRLEACETRVLEMLISKLGKIPVSAELRVQLSSLVREHLSVLFLEEALKQPEDLDALRACKQVFVWQGQASDAKIARDKEVLELIKQLSPLLEKLSRPDRDADSANKAYELAKELSAQAKRAGLKDVQQFAENLEQALESAAAGAMRALRRAVRQGRQTSAEEIADFHKKLGGLREQQIIGRGVISSAMAALAASGKPEKLALVEQIDARFEQVAAVHRRGIVTRWIGKAKLSPEEQADYTDLVKKHAEAMKSSAASQPGETEAARRERQAAPDAMLADFIANVGEKSPTLEVEMGGLRTALQGDSREAVSKAYSQLLQAVQKEEQALFDEYLSLPASQTQRASLQALQLSLVEFLHKPESIQYLMPDHRE